MFNIVLMKVIEKFTTIRACERENQLANEFIAVNSQNQ